jgi:hypothetical protein
VTLALAGGQINACKFSFIGLLKRKGEICFGIYMLFNPCLPTEIKNVTGSRNEIIKNSKYKNKCIFIVAQRLYYLRRTIKQ